MTEAMYCQCRLVRKNPPDECVQFAWIPQKYASVGKVLRLGQEEGWLVTHIWETQPEKVVMVRERAYKRWRDVTDV